MGWTQDAVALVERVPKPPRVVALHLPPDPPPGAERGEFCALELDDGALGIAYVLLGDTLATLRASTRDLRGADALALARGIDGGDRLGRMLGFAAINALTQSLFRRAGFVPPRSADSLGGLVPAPGRTIGMIGHFAPLLKRVVQQGARLVIVELREDLVRDDGVVRVTTDATELAGCDEILVTGATLLNDSLDRMLVHCRHARHLALIGPSVGGPPDPLFARGITLLGGQWVHAPQDFVDALRQGLPTQAFAWKSQLVPGAYPGWDTLLARA